MAKLIIHLNNAEIAYLEEVFYALEPSVKTRVRKKLATASEKLHSGKSVILHAETLPSENQVASENQDGVQFKTTLEDFVDALAPLVVNLLEIPTSKKKKCNGGSSPIV